MYKQWSFMFYKPFQVYGIISRSKFWIYWYLWWHLFDTKQEQDYYVAYSLASRYRRVISYNSVFKGKTKNYRDHILDWLKCGYHRKFIFTYEELLNISDENTEVEVTRIHPEDFMFYNPFFLCYIDTIQWQCKKNSRDYIKNMRWKSSFGATEG